MIYNKSSHKNIDLSLLIFTARSRPIVLHYLNSWRIWRLGNFILIFLVCPRSKSQRIKSISLSSTAWNLVHCDSHRSRWWFNPRGASAGLVNSAFLGCSRRTWRNCIYYSTFSLIFNLNLSCLLNFDLSFILNQFTLLISYRLSHWYWANNITFSFIRWTNSVSDRVECNLHLPLDRSTFNIRNIGRRSLFFEVCWTRSITNHIWYILVIIVAWVGSVSAGYSAYESFRLDLFWWLD